MASISGCPAGLHGRQNLYLSEWLNKLIEDVGTPMWKWQAPPSSHLQKHTKAWKVRQGHIHRGKEHHFNNKNWWWNAQPEDSLSWMTVEKDKKNRSEVSQTKTISKVEMPMGFAYWFCAFLCSLLCSSRKKFLKTPMRSKSAKDRKILPFFPRWTKIPSQTKILCLCNNRFEGLTMSEEVQTVPRNQGAHPGYRVRQSCSALCSSTEAETQWMWSEGEATG